MKKLLILPTIVFSSMLAAHNYDDFEKVDSRKLTLSTSDISQFSIEAGAGSLTLIGHNQSSIDVVADIYQLKAHQNYCLSLEPLTDNGKKAQLLANTCHSNNETRINLNITLPHSLLTSIKDSSGSIELSNASVEFIKDSSGKIKVNDNHTSLSIKDGSGKIEITNLDGNVTIKDGSGAITIGNVTGHVEIDDGSGSISVDSAKSFTLLDDGSGKVRLTNVESQL